MWPEGGFVFTEVLPQMQKEWIKGSGCGRSVSHRGGETKMALPWRGRQGTYMKGRKSSENVGIALYFERKERGTKIPKPALIKRSRLSLGMSLGYVEEDFFEIGEERGGRGGRNLSTHLDVWERKR